MTRELHDIQSKVEARQKVPRCGFIGIHVLVGPRVSLVEVLDEKQQLPEPSLVEHAQQIWKRKVFRLLMVVHVQAEDRLTAAWSPEA